MKFNEIKTDFLQNIYSDSDSLDSELSLSSKSSDATSSSKSSEPENFLDGGKGFTPFTSGNKIYHLEYLS